MAASAPGEQDVRNLLEVAVDVHTDLGKLATGLAHIGASPPAVAELQKMDSIIAAIVKLLGSGPTGAMGQHGEGPGQPAMGAGAPPAAQAAPLAAQGPPPPGPSGPPAGPPGGAPGGFPPNFHSASADLQAALASKHAAAQKALAGQ